MAGLILLLLFLGGIFFLLNREAIDLAALGGDETMTMAAAALFGLYVLFLLTDYRGRVGQALRHFTAWVGIAAGLVALYAYRDELSGLAYRVAGELAPPGQTVTVEGAGGERAVRVRRRPDGHFIARAEVNGANLGMLVDTGASSVVLKPADAEKAGINTRSLTYTVPVQTANGTTYAASVRLRSISVGAIRLTDVEALVAKPGTLRESLLGMTFLRRLRSYEFSGDFLTLRI
jgi:aspartyl protease family protein